MLHILTYPFFLPASAETPHVMSLVVIHAISFPYSEPNANFLDRYYVVSEHKLISHELVNPAAAINNKHNILMGCTYIFKLIQHWENNNPFIFHQDDNMRDMLKRSPRLCHQTICLRKIKCPTLLGFPNACVDEEQQ